jgi:type I restriction enzyme S subunit
VCSLIKDGTHQPPARTKEGPLLLGVTNMIGGKLELTEGDTRIADSFYEAMHKNWQLQPGDVLLAIVGATIGKVAEVPDSFPKFTIQRSVAILRGKHDTLKNRFLRHFLDSKIGQQRIWAKVNQTAQPGVYLGEISQIEIPVPSLAEQERLIGQFDAIQIAAIAAKKHAKQSADLMLSLTNQFC